MSWFQIFIVLISLVGLAGIWGSYICVSAIVRALDASNNDWRRKEAHEKMLKDVAEINMHGRDAVEQLRLIKKF